MLPALCWAQSSAATPTYTLEPVTVSNVAYPPQAREQKIQGRIVARILVSETGNVESVEIPPGDTTLAQATEQAIRGWKFKPVLRDGKPIPVVATVNLNFAPGEEDNGVAPTISPAAELPQRVRVSSAVSQGLILSRVSPKYPSEAKAKHIHAVIVLAAVIGKDGTITDLKLVSGPPELAGAAIDAVRQWRYRPYLLMGRPVEVQATINVNFQ
jgi:TonB family protein